MCAPLLCLWLSGGAAQREPPALRSLGRRLLFILSDASVSTHPHTPSVANPRWLDGDEDGPHVNHSSALDACGERHAIGGHRRPRRGTSMLCDRHQRQRLPPSCSCRRHCVQRRERCVWTQRTPPIWLHSPQCAECNHVGGRAWVRPVRRRRWTQFCGIERGRFRRTPDGDHRTRRATSLYMAQTWPGRAV